MNQPASALFEALSQSQLMQSLGVDVPELHGSLCGYLCGGGQANAENWLSLVLSDEAIHEVEPGSDLARLYDATCAGLASEQFEFNLLLPDTEAPVAERGDALLSWCRGFLGGVGLSGADLKSMSEETQDSLSDMGRIAASELSYDDADIDEEAFEEVAEFVRVAAMLLHSDCVLGPRYRRKLN